LLSSTKEDPLPQSQSEQEVTSFQNMTAPHEEQSCKYK